jgi:hypothetical protein
VALSYNNQKMRKVSSVGFCSKKLRKQKRMVRYAGKNLMVTVKNLYINI